MVPSIIGANIYANSSIYGHDWIYLAIQLLDELGCKVWLVQHNLRSVWDMNTTMTTMYQLKFIIFLLAIEKNKDIKILTRSHHWND